MAADKKNNKSSKRGKTLADSFLNGIKGEEILSSAQRVVSSAVNVLEEEIAAGILAAKKVEKKIIDVDDIRSDPDDLMNRIRRDTHEAVDLFLDALTAITKQVNNLSSSINKEKESSPKQSPSQKTRNDNAVTLVEAEHPVKPGQSVTVQFILFEDDEKTTKIKFQKTHLHGPNNQVINSRALKISPHSTVLIPGKEEEVSILIQIPKNAIKGKYNAFISDANTNVLKVILSVEVIQAHV